MNIQISLTTKQLEKINHEKVFIYFLCNSVLCVLFFSTDIKSVHQIYKLPFGNYVSNVISAGKCFFPV